MTLKEELKWTRRSVSIELGGKKKMSSELFVFSRWQFFCLWITLLTVVSSVNWLGRWQTIDTEQSEELKRKLKPHSHFAEDSELCKLWRRQSLKRIRAEVEVCRHFDFSLGSFQFFSDRGGERKRRGSSDTKTLSLCFYLKGALELFIQSHDAALSSKSAEING